jgi:WD40 repeat protein
VLGEMHKPLKKIMLPARYLYYLLTLDSKTVACAAAKNIILVDVESNNPVILAGHSRNILSLALLDNTTMISSSRDKTIRVWDIPTKSCINTVKFSQTVGYYCVIDHRRIALGNKKMLQVWDIRQGICLKSFTTQCIVGPMQALDHYHIVFAFEKNLFLWNIKSGEQVFQASLDDYVSMITILNRDEVIVIYCICFDIWNIRAGKMMKHFDCEVYCVIPL